jgi:alanyl-tRNA synthetase
LVRKAEGLDMNELRDLSDSLRQKIGSGVVILGSARGDKVFLVVSVSKDLTQRIPAGAVIKELAPLVGGGGGGRPDFAQAGGVNPAALDGALAGSPAIVEKLARD